MSTEHRQLLEEDLLAFADKHSLTRVKTESLDFDRDYKRIESGEFVLAVEKAVIRVLGKVTKVKIGEGEEYPDYESAKKAVTEHWKAYFKAQRENRTDAEKRGEALRQKRYREKKKAELEELKKRQ